MSAPNSLPAGWRHLRGSFSAVVALAALAVALFSLRPAAAPVCLHRQVSGLECPACGLTRSLHAILAGSPPMGRPHPAARPLLLLLGVQLGLRPLALTVRTPWLILADLAQFLALWAGWAFFFLRPGA